MNGHIWIGQGRVPINASAPEMSASDGFFAETRSRREWPIRIPSIALSKSPVSLTRDDEASNIFIRKTCLQPAEFLNTSAKRLLQQYRRIADIARPDRKSIESDLE
jgi:hypothetical protein